MSEPKKSLFELWQYRRFIPDATHTCTAMEDAHLLRRQMEGGDTDDNPIEELLYGQAVGYVARRHSVWWGHNDEYSTPINFCPFCGERLGEIAVGDPIASEVCGTGSAVLLNREQASESPKTDDDAEPRLYRISGSGTGNQSGGR